MKVLITVTTYPQPSRSYDELVCTAGVTEDGSWIRIYPVPFQFLEFGKYQWIELDLVKRKTSQDFRPESYRPRNPDLRDLHVLSQVGTKDSWRQRKEFCLKHVYASMDDLIEASRAPKNTSLAPFRPCRIRRFIVEPDDRDWKAAWLEQLRQLDLFTGGSPGNRTPVEKIPYKFRYEFEDDSGRVSAMSIEDWEIGALYRNCLAQAEGIEEEALEKVKQKYDREFIGTKDITLFLGTTLEHHRKRRPNPFTIIGIFYPPIQKQGALFPSQQG